MSNHKRRAKRKRKRAENFRQQVAAQGVRETPPTRRQAREMRAAYDALTADGARVMGDFGRALDKLRSAGKLPLVGD